MKVTLLGDSIRLAGYGKVVPQLLGDGFEVYQPPENCRFAKYTLRGLFEWERQMAGSKIVHWNNGLWDTCNLFDDGNFCSKEEYLTDVLRIAKILTKRYNKVIFATTTPVNPKQPHNDNKIIKEYNDYVVSHLEKMGVIINDLYGVVYPGIDEYICDDLIHLTDAGIRVCGEKVAEIIRETALTLK